MKIWLKKIQLQTLKGKWKLMLNIWHYYKLVITKLTWSYWMDVRRYDSSSLGTWRERREGIYYIRTTLTTDQVIDRWNRAKLHSDPFFASLFSLSLSLSFLGCILKF
jgi:hypothetical protein